jgi:dihydroxyacetone kinase
LILKQDDPERSFVKFKDGDDLVLLVNNQGGMSALEMGAVVDETLTQLGQCPPVLTAYKSPADN